MRRRIPEICLLIISVVYSFSVQSQFRVIGYVQPWGETPDVSKIAFDKLTHLNIAFVNPDSSGNLLLPAGLDTLH